MRMTARTAWEEMLFPEDLRVERWEKQRNPSGLRSHVHQGGRVEDFDPPEHVKEAAVKFARAIGMVIGGVDFLFGEKEGEFYLCEANSSIGMSMETFNEVRSTIDAIMQRADRGPEGKS